MSAKCALKKGKSVSALTRELKRFSPACTGNVRVNTMCDVTYLLRTVCKISVQLPLEAIGCVDGIDDRRQFCQFELRRVELVDLLKKQTDAIAVFREPKNVLGRDP